MSPVRLVALRQQHPDRTILDWLELLELLPDRYGVLTTAELCAHWECDQSTVSRRIRACALADLLFYRAGGGRYRITITETL